MQAILSGSFWKIRNAQVCLCGWVPEYYGFPNIIVSGASKFADPRARVGQSHMLNSGYTTSTRERSEQTKIRIDKISAYK